MQRYLIIFVFTTLLTYSCQENFEQRIQRETAEYTQRHCPSTIEPGNTLDSMTYQLPTRTLIRWYTLSGPMDTPAARQLMSQHQDAVRQQLLLELRNDTQWNTCKDQHISFSYVYRSASQGTELFRITLNPEDYRY